MWDIKAGDEVVVVDTDERPSASKDPRDKLIGGAVYVVEAVIVWRGEIGLVLVGHHSSHNTGAFLAKAFRKVQRRDLTEWLATENTINEPTRSPEMEPA